MTLKVSERRAEVCEGARMANAFGTILKGWRSRRRFSQLTLGLSANVSARHVAFLETGRARPSRAMVLRLAETLEMPRDARNQMLEAAGFVSAYERRTLDARAMIHVRAAIDWSLERHMPYPAFAKDRHWNIVAANPSALAMLASAGIAIGDSLLEPVADEAWLQRTFANAGEVAHHLLQRLRIEMAYLGGDPVLDAAIKAMQAMPLLQTFEPQSPLPPVVPTLYRAGDKVLSFFGTLAQFGTAEDLMLSDLQLEFLFPANEETRLCIEAMQLV